MADGKTTEQLKSLQEKRGKIEAKIQKLTAADLVRKRKQELQRKFLVGSYYLELAAKENKLDNLNSTMHTWLTSEIDKKLFKAG